MTKTESQIQREIITYLRSQNWLVIRNHTQGLKYTGGRSTNPNKGMPDLLVVKDSYYLWIEVKKPGGSLSIDQIKWHENARKYGMNVAVLHDAKQCVAMENFKWK